PLKLDFRHLYMMRDTGSYLTRGGGEIYSPSNENVEHSLNIDLRYQPSEDFTLKALADFRNQRSNRLGSVGGRSAILSSRINESGGLKLGFVRKRDIGDNGKLDLDIAYVRRFGPHLSKERKEYWEVDASLKFNF
ncbi:MAG: hypothetical protein KAX38_05865, partial [Candidatus Krumholzibacteria bacterium]|nr:hypothetical protein [Candidatus Krumholzibacteria bacterium]